MRIENSAVQLSSVHEKSSLHTVEERLNVWGPVPPDEATSDFDADQRASRQEGIDASMRLDAELMRTSLERSGTFFSSASRVSDEGGTDSDRRLRGSHASGHRIAETGAHKAGEEDAEEMEISAGGMRLEVMRLLVEKLSGEKVHLYRPSDAPAETGSDGSEVEKRAMDTAEPEGAPDRVGWGVEYDYEEIRAESEHSAFSSSGVVKTADGREIAFDVDLQMSRERIDVTHLSVRAGDARVTDPLVINFNGNATELTEEKINFDLDADGISEPISFVRSGSGFLVLDRNGDGRVNDGTELFGPATGDGFAELAAYDEDQNGWIDEGDNVYDALGVWSRTQDGTDVLSSLRQADIGAVYLQSVATPFDLKNAKNETDGLVRTTGVYLKESGAAGTVQQVDLVT